MKHTEATKKKISETMKRRGIKPTVLPSKEQCLINLKKAQEKEVWNKGRTDLPPSWNKGIEMSQNTKDKLRETFFTKNHIPWNKEEHKKCMDCGMELARRRAERCIRCNGLNNRGENHYAWKGGIGQPFRRTGKYKQWRMDVFRRDWFTCQISECGYKGKDIQAHHIVPFRVDETKAFDTNNGITLCEECHLPTRWKEKEFEKQFISLITIRE